ncbi:unnamed protein product [Clonostachys solani]|uniref:Transcription factor domain-containing protein n=1 Tax=Clonostachys solani TaxID=160281 RepID=A0A9P0ELD9_9HYPO|nr:unnamed protein product [Clonostachys solani]
MDDSPQDCTLWVSDLFNTAVGTTDLQVDVNDAEMENEQVSSWNSPGDSHFIGLEDLLPSKNTPILDLTYLMPDDIALSMLDRQAIDFYTSDFSHIHITKRFPWSTNALLLRLGYETPIVMRFLLAASLNELHRRESAPSVEFKELAEVHFKIGCSHFSGLVPRGDGIPIDPRPVLASVFFAFLYLSRRKSVDRSKIRSLSKTASDYIREHELDTLGTTSVEPVPLGASLVQKFDSPSDKRLISQLMRWIFFKDVQMAFHGCGGSVASHILGAVKSHDRLSRASSSLVNNIWGARFHATRIYFFRAALPVHTQCPPGEALPAAVQNSLSAILAIAHGMFASELPSPYERLQWPLFMAGIETQDVIYREWILSHMRPSALKTSLSRVIKAQSYIGYRLGIAIIKDIIKDVDRNIAAGNALEAFGSQDSDSWVDVEDENDFCLW